MTLTFKTKPNRREQSQAPDVTWRYFDSDLVDRLGAKEQAVDPSTGWTIGQYRLQTPNFTFYLARKFGFCYGVKLAIWDALAALGKHADSRVVALSEMIHNPYVNDELRRRGALFLDEAGLGLDDVLPTDVVIIPAFGTTTTNFAQLAELAERGCTLVDTTCHSVIDVWDRVREYNAGGLTSIIHGKAEHEETIATASFADRYLIVRDLDQTEQLCRHLKGELDWDGLLASLSPGSVSETFDPTTDLDRLGMANQTTMRSSESEAVFARVRQAIVDVRGEPVVDHHYQALDTICRATEVRQQAVIELTANAQLDLMVVIGGLNSSNTKNLARIAGQSTAAYHIEGAWSFDGDRIRHLVCSAEGTPELQTAVDWLPQSGHIGVTAGASTPDNTVGQVIEKILTLRTP